MLGPSRENRRVLNPDFKDMLSVFSAEGVEFLVVGAYAMAAHGAPRATGDLDFWIRASEQNVERLVRALNQFGAPTESIAPKDFLAPDVVFQIGVEPNRIDLLTNIDGVDFDSAWANRITARVGGMEVPVLGLNDLIANKSAVARARDVADVAELKRIRDSK
jgi:predicted nucleotidyltransferase